MEFSRQEHCSCFPFPPPGDLPDLGIEPGSPLLQADSLWSEPPGKPNRWEDWGNKMLSNLSKVNKQYVQRGHLKLSSMSPKSMFLITMLSCLFTSYTISIIKIYNKCHQGSVQSSHSVMSNSLRPHESQHTRPPCPSPTPGVYSNSCPSSWWCHPTISSSVVPFSSCPQSLPASGSFPMSQLFAWDGQSIGVSASASVLPMNTQDWSPLGWTSWISLQSKGL